MRISDWSSDVCSSDLLCEASEQWDRRVCVLQVTDANEQTMQLRMLVSSTDSGRNFDLRCQVREGLIAFVQAHYPHALPRWRGEQNGRASCRERGCRYV